MIVSINIEGFENQHQKSKKMQTQTMVFAVTRQTDLLPKRTSVVNIQQFYLFALLKISLPVEQVCVFNFHIYDT